MEQAGSALEHASGSLKANKAVQPRLEAKSCSVGGRCMRSDIVWPSFGTGSPIRRVISLCRAVDARGRCPRRRPAVWVFSSARMPGADVKHELLHMVYNFTAVGTAKRSRSGVELILLLCLCGGFTCLFEVMAAVSNQARALRHASKVPCPFLCELGSCRVSDVQGSDTRQCRPYRQILTSCWLQQRATQPSWPLQLPRPAIPNEFVEGSLQRSGHGHREVRNDKYVMGSDPQPGPRFGFLSPRVRSLPGRSRSISRTDFATQAVQAAASVD